MLLTDAYDSSHDHFPYNCYIPGVNYPLRGIPLQITTGLCVVYLNIL